MWRVGLLSGSGVLEMDVGGKVVCFGSNGVEVVDDVGSGGRNLPISGKTNVVNASVCGVPI